MSQANPSPTQRSAPSCIACIAWLALAALAPSMAHSDTLSIADAMRLATREAPLLAAEAARVSAAREDAVRADALPDPTLTLAVDNLPITGNQAWQLGADMMTMRRVGLMQDWPSRAKRDARRALAEANVGERAASETATRLMVQREAALAWLERWQAELELRLLDELRAETERTAELIDARLRAGQGNAADVLGARAELVALDTRRIGAEADIAASRASLARWLDAEAGRALDAEPDFDVLPVAAAVLHAQLDRHAALQLAGSRAEASERAVAVARAERRPDLRFGAAYGARSGGAADMLMLEVGIGLPLFAGNRQDRDVAARRAESDAARADLDDLRRQQRTALERELAQWEGLRRQTEAFRTQLLPLSRDRVALALTGYRSGGPLQAWTSAHHDQTQALLDYARTRAALGASWVRLATLLPESAP
jgi:outer membrane protein, heavy metal efflux system